MLCRRPETMDVGSPKPWRTWNSWSPVRVCFRKKVLKVRSGFSCLYHLEWWGTHAFALSNQKDRNKVSCLLITI